MLAEMTTGDWIGICSLVVAGVAVPVILHFWPKKKDEDCSSETTLGDSQKIEKVHAKAVTAVQGVLDESQRKAGGQYIEHLTVNVAEGGKFELILPAIDYQDGVAESLIPKVRKQFEVGRWHVEKGEFREAIGVFEACLGFEKDNEKRGAINIQLGNCYYELRRYIDAGRFYEGGLKEAQKAGDVEGKASALINIANTFMLRPAADGATRGNNVKEAVQCYNEALKFFTKDEYPVQYAMTQNNLGTAYTDLPSATSEERAKNVRSAIACYKAALEIRKKDEYPQDYCMTAANLGMVLVDIDKGKACYWLKEAYALREFLPDQGKRLEEIIEKVCE